MLTAKHGRRVKQTLRSIALPPYTLVLGTKHKPQIPHENPFISHQAHEETAPFFGRWAWRGSNCSPVSVGRPLAICGIVELGRDEEVWFGQGDVSGSHL